MPWVSYPTFIYVANNEGLNVEDGVELGANTGQDAQGRLTLPMSVSPQQH